MSQIESKRISQKWQRTLSNLVREAETYVQSSQRQRKMSVEVLVQSLVLGCLEAEASSLRLWCETAHDLGCEISQSSLDERLTKRLVVLLHEVLQLSIQEQVKVKSLPVEALKKLSHVVLYDSSSLSLPTRFKELFRASGSNPDLGQMKLQVGYDYLKAQLLSIRIEEGIVPDQKDAGLLAHAVKDALLVFDLGYFNQQLFGKISAQGAYFLSRFQSQASLYEAETEKAVDIVELLKASCAGFFEAKLLLGAKAKCPVRLVARRVSQQEAEKRRWRIQRQAKQGGYTASARNLFLCGWEILITNLASEWTSQKLFDLYRLRWQIELLFKAWKSYLDLSKFGNWRVERILVQIYATLIGAVLSQALFASVRYELGESSLFKSIRIIRRRIAQLLAIIRRNWWGFEAWMWRLKQELLKFGQQQKLEMAPSSLGRLINWG